MYKSRKYRARRGPRRAFKKRSFRRGIRVTANLSKTALVRPDRLIVKLPWTQNYIYGTNTTTTTNKAFRLNSIWDPDFASGLGQNSAMGLVQWQSFYTRYRVYGASVDVTLDNNGAVGIPTAMHSGLTTYTSATEYNEVAMQPHCTSTILGTSTGMSRIHRRFFVKCPMIIGQTAAEYRGDDANYSVFTDNPGRDIILNIVHAPTSAAVPVVLLIKITYHVELFNPVPMFSA